MATDVYAITASGDDGYWSWRSDNNSKTITDNNSLRFGYSASSANRLYGLMLYFRDVQIPFGATVSTAPITAYLSYLDVDSGASPSLVARAHDTGTPSMPETGEDAIEGVLTTASANVPTPTDMQEDTVITLVDVAPVLNAIFRRVDWSAGNDILIDIRDANTTDPAEVHDNARFDFDAFNDSNAVAVPTISITWTPNTAPEITVGPTVTYASSFTRLGPNATPATVTFTATDAEDTGANELTWEIRTAASGGGTLVATGSCTSGTSENASVAHNASGISEGSNTLYLRVGDGSLWSDDESFTVLMDATAPTVGTITHSPNPVTET